MPIKPELPWIEKYRPKKLTEIVGQKDITKRLEAATKKKNLPNLLFSGPAGIGKTSTAVALSTELFTKGFERNFLELNASVTGDTPVLVKQGEKTRRTNFNQLAEEYFQTNENYAFTKNLQTLSVDENYFVGFKPVSLISRHKVKKIAKIKFEGGEIKTSLNHSVMVLDSYGKLVSKECKDLKKNDLLLSFSQEIESKKIKNVNFEEFSPQLYNELKSGHIKNPKVQMVLKQRMLDFDLSWLFGMYLAEGCTGFNKKGSAGVTIFTLGYPQEKEVAQRISKIIDEKFDLKAKFVLGRSGFDRRKKSSIQVRILNTQLAKFFKEHFYDSSGIRKAKTKRVPHFIFTSPISERLAFLQGYLGDAHGEWGKTVKYTSKSQENLIDASWLARSCGLNTTLYKEQLDISWEKPSHYSNPKSELLPAEPFIKACEREKINEDFNFRYHFRHSLYYKKSKRIRKNIIKKLFDSIPIEKRVKLSKLEQIANSGINSVLIKSVEIEKYDKWVYDFSVPQSEMFFGGTAPVLLHNSDERGIDVVRKTIKDFARTLAFDADFKIIFLDEADALTTDAQQALRRTMEKYTKTCRFILSCNYSSRIIEPIQSRCVIFRFKPLKSKDIENRIKEIEKKEGLKIENKAIEAIIYVSQGDLRKAVNILQAAAALDTNIKEKAIYDVSSRAQPTEIKELIKLALEQKFLEARKQLDTLLYEHGMSGEDIMLQIYRELIDYPETEMPAKTKIDLIDTLGEYNFRLVQGANERIQLEALIAQFMKYNK